jgi:4-hydroxyphenylpyruvate dioxygenase
VQRLFLGLNFRASMKIDRIHFYVQDATASRDWFVRIMGFQEVAQMSCNHTRSYVVKSQAVYFALSSALTSASPVAEYLRLHPPGVVDVAFRVSDVEAVMEKAVNGGAKVLQPIQQQHLSGGYVKWGKIAAWGSLSHTLIEVRSNQSFLIPQIPLALDKKLLTNEKEVFTGIDHVVLNVAAGDLERAVAWYENALGLHPQQSFAIQTEKSGLRSQVMVDPSRGVQLPINEPTSANSQIQEFLDVNRGAGIQHLALQTPDIVKAIAHLRDSGLSFLPVPSSYYTQLRQRHPKRDLPAAEWEAIAAQEILVDWHEEDASQALLLQTFTQPIFGEPTFFFELIERLKQARGFGEGNFRALFEAIEREQLKRGSLERSDTV